MTLEGLLDAGKRTARRVTLAVALLAAPYLGCGDDVPQGDDDTQSDGACGDSPLVGKYLWEVSTCRIGSVNPFNEDCTADLQDGASDRPNTYFFHVREYSGLTLLFDPSWGRESFGFDTLYLTRPARAELPSFEECKDKVGISNNSEDLTRAEWETKINRGLCYQERNPNIYMGLMLEPFDPDGPSESSEHRPHYCAGTNWWINDSPWRPHTSEPRDDDCTRSIHDEEWNRQCDRLYPDPNPCDYVDCDE